MVRILPLLLLTLSCTLHAQEKKDTKLPAIKVVPYAGGAIDFDKHVQPILDNKCTSCHSGSIKKGRLDLSSYEGILKGGKTGPAVVAGKPAESLLIKLAGRTDAPAMPPKDDEPLSPEELALLKAWIHQGAKGSMAEATVKSAATVKLMKLAERLKPVLAISISTDKKIIAAGRGATISLYGADKGELIRTLVDTQLSDEQGKPSGQSQTDFIQAMLFSPDGEKLFAAGYKEVTIWNVKSGNILHKLTGFSDRVVALDLSPDGKYLATAGGVPTQEGEVIVFDVNSKQSIMTLTTPHSDTVFGVRFSPDGSMLATSGADKFVKVWAMKPLLRQEAVAQPISMVSSLMSPWSVPGATVARQTIALERIHHSDWTPIKPGQQLRSFEGHTHHVLDVAWRADGKTLVSAGADNVLKVWDYEKGEQIRTIGGHTKQISRLSMLRTAPMVYSACGDAGLRQWNIDTGGNVRNITGANDFLQTVAASSDGSLLAAGGEEGLIRVYNGQTGALVKTLPLAK